MNLNLVPKGYGTETRMTMSKIKFSEEKIFSSLVTSAFDFLNKAIDEFDTSAKFSTVHFAIAIELFLKARLLREHWSLLIEKTDKADRNSFIKGELKTIGPDQTMQRLKNIAGAPVPVPTQEIFMKIFKHRNKMVHFIHDGDYTQDDTNAITTQIATEQCTGWLAIRQLLSHWREYFNDWKKDIQEISFKMEKHHAYLAEYFKIQADKIEKHKAGGGSVNQCPSCNFNAVLVGEPIGSISPASCTVCWYAGAEIEIACDQYKCHETIHFDSYEGPPDFCPSCKSPINEEFVKEALDTGPLITKDNYFEHVDKNCPYCTGYHTVVEHHDWFVCSECYEVSEKIGTCEFCSEAQLGGVPEHSSMVGCEFCEGAAGHFMND